MDIHAFEEQLSQALGLIDGVQCSARDAQDTWTLVFDDTLAIELQWLASTRQILLTAVIDPPPADQRCRVMESMLIYNALWRDTGGVRLACGGEGQAFLLIYECRELPSSPAALIALLGGFVDLATWWSTYSLSASPAKAAPDAMHLHTLA